MLPTIEALDRRLLLSVTPLLYGPDTQVAAPLVSTSVAPNQVASYTQPNHLVINPSWDSTITNDPNAALIEADLGKMISNFEYDYTTPITINVKFKEVTSGLAQSLTAITQVSYSSYRAALAAHASDSRDTAAVASLPKTTANPVNGASEIVLSDPNARALGFSATPQGGLDATIGLNMSAFNLTRNGNQIDPNKYDIIGSSSHEMDEVLGVSSTLNANNSNHPIPTTFLNAEDLFRYNPYSTGVRSFTTNPNASAAFSFDGGHTFVAAFNQTQGGDYNDWYSPGSQAPQVQDAFGTPGAVVNLGTEIVVEDVLGYTLASGVNGGFKPDLAPEALPGWSSPLVLTTTKGSLVSSSPLPSNQTLYVDAAVQNIGETSTASAIVNTITLDGKTIFTFNDPAGLAVNNAYYSTGLSLGELSPGSHTISITANSTNTVSEIISSNNTYQVTFTVTAVKSAPKITTQPLSQTVATGAKVTFTAAASGYPTPTVQWQVSTNGGSAWSNISGATSTTYSFTTASTASVKEYRAVFTNSQGSTASSAATLTVKVPAAPVVTTQPVSQSIAAGSKVTFTAAASGYPTPTVQWQVSTNGSTWVNLTGATATTYSFTTSATENGNQYRAVFTNSKGSADSKPAKLTVTSSATGTISGFVYNTNNDGGISGWPIFLDLNKDGYYESNEPLVYTDANGDFEFTNLPLRSYYVEQIASQYYTLSYPASGYYNVTISSAHPNVTGVAFGDTPNGAQKPKANAVAELNYIPTAQAVPAPTTSSQDPADPVDQLTSAS